MALTNDISKALERIRSGQDQPADLERLQQAAAQGSIVVDGGERGMIVYGYKFRPVVFMPAG